MSKISLRAYTRDIDTLIDLGQLDEAIGHCRHVLSKFPKHIDTYRLLGKAYLEGNQNSNAADIFQRVLSAVPDDFVSHIGMSLIREEEGNLQSAINHMERAFERQPYNNAIQEEIRRLYGKRDGIEPPKVRLTQGALARMYLKGGLISQGIAELRSALADQPERFDLRTLLAEAYQTADQMGKAIEIASVILKRFPFNLVANRILAQTLKTHDHPEEMAICRKRLYALSPYEAYVSEHAPTVDEVPDQAITIEKLDASQIEEDYSLPAEADVDWETALGEDTDREAEADAEEPVPDWLAGMTKEELAEMEEGVESTAAETESDAALEEETPDIAPQKEQEMELDQEYEEEPVPAWLAGLPDEDTADESPSPSHMEEEEIEESPPAETPSAEVSTDLEEMDELPPADEAEQGTPETIESTEEEEFVSEVEEDTPLDAISEEELAEEEGDEPVPEWMEEAGWEASESPASEPDDIYADEDWDEDDDDLEPAEIPDWLQEKSPEAIDDVSPEMTEGDEIRQIEDEDQDEDFVPDWLAGQEDTSPDVDSEDISQREPAVQEEQASAEEREITDITPRDLEGDLDDEDMDDFPDWLRDLKSDEEEQETTVSWLNNFAQESPPEVEDIPAVEEKESIEPDFSEPAPEDLEEPEWMRQESPESTAPPSEPGSGEILEDAPDKDDDLEDYQPDDEVEDEITPMVSEEDEFETDPISEFEQGDGLIAQELDDEDDFPDWLDELDDQAEEDYTADEVPAEISGEADLPSPSDEPTPSMDESMEDREPERFSAEAAHEDQDAEGELPAWLDDLDAEEERIGDVEEEPVASDVPPDTPEHDAEEAQFFPEELDEVEETQEPTQFPADVVEDEPSPPEEMEGETIGEADLDDEDETLAWLEGLAEKQGADQEDFVTSAEERAQAQAPEIEKEKEAPQDTREEEPPSAEEELPKADMPDWLAELEPAEESTIEDDVQPLDERAATDRPEPDQVEMDIEDDEALPGWLEELGKDEEEVFESADDDRPEQVKAETPVDEGKGEGEIPDWLGELEPREETPPDTGQPTAEDMEETLPDSVEISEEKEELAGEEDDMAWLESLAGKPDTIEEEFPSPEDHTQEQVEEGDQTAEEDVDDYLVSEKPQQDEDLPDWLSELEREDEEIEELDEADEFLTSEEEFVSDDEALDWLADLEEAEEEAQEFMTVDEDDDLESEPAFREDLESPPDALPSEGMLKRLGDLDKEQEQTEAEAADEVPDWLTDFKEEEDPQETAVLWLRKYVESGGDVDLEKELQEYTDSLGTEEVPEWVQDLQEEEDPTSTAMLWLERLEQEEAFRHEEERTREESAESDWLAELEKEEQRSEAPPAAQDTRDEFDIDEEGWLSDLEEEDREKDHQVEETPEDLETEQDEIEGDEEDVPPWMLATSPLEGDLLTGDLIDESEEEEIPDWLAGYEEEEDIPLGDEGDAEADEYAWLSAYDEDEHQADRKIDLNNAPISQLESLIGINFEIAEAIVSYREEHGSFQSFNDLQAIPAVQEGQVLDILRSNTMIAPQEQPADEATPDVPATKEEIVEPETIPQPAEAPETESSLLDAARKKFKSGDIDGALEHYEKLIDDKEDIDQVIDDLSEATYDHPMNVEIIKTLGDAYMRIDKLQEALDAYSKAEDLIR